MTMGGRIVALMSVLVLSACQQDSGPAAVKRQELSFPTMTVQQVEMPVTYSVPGTVVSDVRIDLSSRVVGFIKKLDVREGKRVAKGDLLIQIDSAEIDELIRQAQAGLASAREDLTDAERDVEKYSKLAKDGWSPTEVLRKSRVRRDIAQSSLSKAQAVLASALAQRDYATIRSPVDGVVLARHKQSGEMTTVGTPILTIESREMLLFKVFVSENKVGWITPNMLAEVLIDAMPGDTILGSVQRIVPSGDPVTRRYEINAILPSRSGILPGMFGRAEFLLGSEPVLAVSPEALVERGGLTGVFVVGRGNIASFRWLRLGRMWGGLVEVTSGLSTGETILTRADDTVRDGSLIITETEKGPGKNG